MFKTVFLLALIYALLNLGWAIKQWNKVVEFAEPAITYVKTQDNIFSGLLADIQATDFSKLGQQKPESVCKDLSNIKTTPKYVKAKSFDSPNIIENHCISLKGIKNVSCLYTCQTNPIGKGWGICWWKRQPCNLSTYMPQTVKVQSGW